MSNSSVENFCPPFSVKALTPKLSISKCSPKSLSSSLPPQSLPPLSTAAKTVPSSAAWSCRSGQSHRWARWVRRQEQHCLIKAQFSLQCNPGIGRVGTVASWYVFSSSYNHSPEPTSTFFSASLFAELNFFSVLLLLL